MAQTQTLAGTVTRVTKNRDGFQLDSEPGKYLNLSKQHNPPCPNEGDSVLIEVEGGKWVNSITRQGAPASIASASPVTDLGAGRERLIARQVALKAAIDFDRSSVMAQHDGWSLDELLECAAAFEAWILR